GMDGKVKPSNANKKLVQARLPFKRLNPEPKETSEPKRTRALPCPEPGLSDGENESEISPLPMRHGPALVNGRGPLDGFMSHSSRTFPAKIIVVLTEDFNSTDPLKQQPATPISALCPPTKNNHQSKTLSAVTATKTDHTAKTGQLDCKRLKAEKAEITRFLQKPKTPQQATKTLVSACGKFAPFEIKEHMGLAPLTRVQCEEAVLDELDRYLAKPDGSLHGLRDWTRNEPRRSGPTKPRSTDSMRECIVIVQGPKPDGVPDRQRYGRMKLLQFRENYRPAYWGTWSKKSPHISPRYPLRQDKVLLDYEVDSDEEWEEEEPGESLSHSEGEDNDEGCENDDDDEDGFFVPHGYLSDGEGALEEEEGGDPEKQKVRQKLKAREWDELMAKKKVKVLEVVVRGCVWEGEGPPLELFQQFAVCLVEPLPKPEPTTPEDYAQKLKQKLQEDELLLSQLLPLLHGNVNSNKVIITEFQEFCRQKLTSTISSPQNSGDIPTRIRLKRLIKGNAMYEKRSAYRRCCWYIHTEVLARFSQEALPVPCQWNYLTSGAHVSREEASAATGSLGNSPTTSQTSTTPSSSNKRKSAGSMSITKFMKKAADPEQAHEMDGFQADTEEDEDETDCVIIRTQKGETSK
uniref:Chromatin assembly factor 1, subunit A (p150) n=1 Tax=Oncorhynchus kisutch TaxID=8019 RepID=A0A8C7IVY4_ONCKI